MTEPYGELTEFKIEPYKPNILTDNIINGRAVFVIVVNADRTVHVLSHPENPVVPEDGNLAPIEADSVQEDAPAAAGTSATDVSEVILQLKMNVTFCGCKVKNGVNRQCWRLYGPSSACCLTANPCTNPGNCP
jgi:hypothetical protein